MIVATRRHEICCGHRIHLHESKCAHLHGHNYGFTFHCTAPGLDKAGRVVDFSVIKATLCQWLEEQWDHRTLICNEDPWAMTLQLLDRDGIVLVPFIPTAENLARWMVDVVGPDLLQGVTLVRCDVDETSKCSATYEREDPEKLKHHLVSLVQAGVISINEAHQQLEKYGL